MPHSTDDLAEADAALVQAQLAGDAAALDALLDDEVQFVEAGGEPLDKWAVVEAYRSGQRRLHRVDVERQRVRVLGELGVVTSTARLEGVEAGGPFHRRERHTRTWRLGETWTLVASHASAVTDEPQPGAPNGRLPGYAVALMTVRSAGGPALRAERSITRICGGNDDRSIRRLRV